VAIHPTFKAIYYEQFIFISSEFRINPLNLQFESIPAANEPGVYVKLAMNMVRKWGILQHLPSDNNWSLVLVVLLTWLANDKKENPASASEWCRIVSTSLLFRSHQYSDQIAVETLGNLVWALARKLAPNIPQHGAGELSLRLTDDQEIQALNFNNKPTDVLAFAALELECPQPEMKFPYLWWYCYLCWYS